MITVNILQLKDGRTYTGISKRPWNRFLEHAKGRSKSTRRFLPIELIHTVQLENYKLARSSEVLIKGRGPKKWLNDQHFRHADIRVIQPGDKEFPPDKGTELKPDRPDKPDRPGAGGR